MCQTAVQLLASLAANYSTPTDAIELADAWLTLCDTLQVQMPGTLSATCQQPCTSGAGAWVGRAGCCADVSVGL
jgi:hypothetical protein